jgi:hypothetical protein
MGWWHESNETKGLEVGDEPLDLLRTCLESISACYQAELGRKPCLDELLWAIHRVLDIAGSEQLSDLSSRQITAIEIKTRAISKVQPYGIGDLFCIHVQAREYFYGRILMKTTAGMLIEIYDIKSPILLTQHQLLSTPKTVLTYKHVNGIECFRKKKWPIIGHDAIPQSYEYPKFYIGSKHAFFIIVQGDYRRRVTSEEAMSVEPMIMFSLDTVEKNLLRCGRGSWPEVQIVMTRDFGH